MPELTTDQLTDLRGDIGDTGSAQAFTDAELQRLYTRAVADGGDYDLTVVYAIRRLLASAAKLVTYKQGGTFQDDDQMFTHLEKLLDRWERIAGVGGGLIRTGVILLGLDEVDSSSEWT